MAQLKIRFSYPTPFQILYFVLAGKVRVALCFVLAAKVRVAFSKAVNIVILDNIDD